MELEAEVALTFGVANGGTRPASKMRVSFEAIGNIDLSRDAHDPDDDEDQNDDDGQSALPPIPRLPAPPVAPAVRLIVKRPPTASKGVIATLRMLGSGLRISELEKASRGVMSGLGPQLAAMRSAQSMFDNLHGRGALADLARGIGPMSDMMRTAEEHDRLRRSLIQPTGIARPTYIDIPAIRVPSMPEKHNPEGFYYDRWPKGN